MQELISRDAIVSNAARIAPWIRKTPVLTVRGDDVGLDLDTVSLKLELLQCSGSFKARGAFTNLLAREVPPAGIVAASGGNHGAAVAYAAMRLQKRASIYVPSISSAPKVAKIRAYGAQLVVGGASYAEALAASEAFRAESGAMAVHAFDSIETILGTATLAHELVEQVARVDTVLVAVGGGGLLAGIAAWFAGSAKVIGVEPTGAPTLTRALEAGRPVDAEVGSVAADSLAPRRVGELVFPIAKQWVERVVLVTDEAIRAAQRELHRGLDVVAEPGGAAAFAALLSGAYVPARGERVVVVVSGGNGAKVDFES